MASNGTIYSRYALLAGRPKVYLSPLPCARALRGILGPWVLGYDLPSLVQRCRMSGGRYQVPPFMTPDELGAWLDESALLDE